MVPVLIIAAMKATYHYNLRGIDNGYFIAMKVIPPSIKESDPS